MHDLVSIVKKLFRISNYLKKKNHEFNFAPDYYGYTGIFDVDIKLKL